jgi:hypothetical protein
MVISIIGFSAIIVLFFKCVVTITMNTLNNSQLILSSISHKEGLHADSFTYQSIFLSLIVPDESNARFLPAVLIEDDDAKLFVTRRMTKKQLVDKYNGEDHVIIGKSCMINCLKYDSNDWKKANKTIASIIELGHNITVSELIQAPTLYPHGDGKYQVLTGHRRYFALVYANGYSSAAQFKLYESKPLLAKIKQFQENASRDELPQYGKLQAFESAIIEIDQLNTARTQCGYKKLTVKETAINLGISMGAYDNYNVLTRYPCIVEAYESGLSSPFLKVKKLVLEVESSYKQQHGKSVLNITDKNNISETIKTRLYDKKAPKPVNTNFPIKPLKRCSTVKALLTSNVMALDTGINWDEIDWDDHANVSETLSTVLAYLEKAPAQ